ncbi:MAG: right-handed parallel beta-helix repeat-containing protein [Burkholderiales bacterium]
MLRSVRIALQSPLPPLVNAAGVVIEGAAEASEIDARLIGSGSVFDIEAPDSVIRGVHVLNAPGGAILVRASGVRLQDLRLANCDEGLLVAEESDNLVVEQVRFEGNRIGARILSPGRGVILRNNRFHGNREVGVSAVRADWAAGAQRGALQLSGNRFQDDRVSLVLGNVAVKVEGNEVLKAREAGIVLIGQGGELRRNRVTRGAGMGVVADATRSAVIEDNEIDNNGTLGILVRSSAGALVRKNRIYDNPYGVAFVLGERAAPDLAVENVVLRQRFDGIIVIGSSPILRHNQMRNSRRAALRILDFVPLEGARVAADPYLEGNSATGNLIDAPVRGEYRVQPREVQP